MELAQKKEDSRPARREKIVERAWSQYFRNGLRFPYKPFTVSHRLPFYPLLFLSENMDVHEGRCVDQDELIVDK